MTRSSNMAKAEEWSEARPRGLWRYGLEFITVGHDALDSHRKREIAGRGPNRSHVPLSSRAPFPIYYNFLHGVELGLKAYLLSVKAATIEELRSKKFGHNLDRLLNKALDYDRRSGCLELTDAHISVICSSNELYASKQFEYIKIGEAQLMPIDSVAEAADTLIAGLGVLICPGGFLKKFSRDLAWLKRALDRRDPGRSPAQ